MLKKGVNILLGTSNETLKQIFRALADSLNVSETTTKEIIASYEAVGTYLGNLEEDLDIKISPQGSMALGTMIKPLSSDKNGEYDVDLICQLVTGPSIRSNFCPFVIVIKIPPSSLRGEFRPLAS